MDNEQLTFIDDEETIPIDRSGKNYKESCIERSEREHIAENIERFQQMQIMPYDAKVSHAAVMARDFCNAITSPVGDYYANCHVSVGGLDSK